jgi:hypothetical protein
MRRLFLIGLLLAAFWPAAAQAAVPCRDKIYNDWYGDGKIATSYPISCYRDALKHAPTDARIYSSLVDDIKSAMQGALERHSGAKKVPAEVGRGLTSVSDKTATTVTTGGVKAKHIVLHPSASKAKAQRTDTTVAVGPTSSSGGGGGSGIPTPIIVLGALALLLAAIGAVGTGVRHYRRR